LSEGVSVVVLDKEAKLHFSLLVVVIVVFIWSFIKPAVFWTWVAEASPSVVALIIIIFTYKKFRLTSLSYWIIAILSILTFIGGHYTYAEVPLFNWIKDEYNLQRNHYDRFGHFLKGYSAIVVREILVRNTPLTKGSWLFAISTSIVMAIAALYEIVEWLSTKLPYAKKATEDFLGMQGDEWDAQWDMSFALIGAILALLTLSKLHNHQLKKLNNKF
jgi:putative membrane protein